MIDICNSVKDPFTLICSVSKSFNAERLEAANELEMKELIEDAYAFATSFILKRNETMNEDMADHSANHLIMINHAQKAHTSLNDLNDLQRFAIDFSLVEKMIGKL